MNYSQNTHGTPTFLILLFLLSIFNIIVFAAPGDLDTTFDNDGKQTTKIGNGSDQATDAVLQPDGKIIVVGSSVAGNEGNVALVNIAVARYDLDGTLDTTFGTNGKSVVNLGNAVERLKIGLQDDGKIIITGIRQDIPGGSILLPFVARLNADGSLDTGFGSNGFRTINFVEPKDIVVQTDNRIVLVGNTLSNNSNVVFSAMRLNSDGTTDNSFGIDGFVSTAIGSGHSLVEGLALQTDGKILLAGTSSNGADEDFAVVRYNTNGSLDTSFDGDGRLSVPIGAGNDRVYSIALQSDNKILLAGRVQVGSPVSSSFGIARLNTDGTFDTSFDSDGKVVVSIGASNNFALDVDIQSDGKIVASGATFDSGQTGYAIARFDADGTFDTTFDSDGQLILFANSEDYLSFSQTHIQPNGRVFLTGSARYSVIKVDFLSFQLNSDGSKANSKRDRFNSGYDIGRDVAIQSDGKIVVAGESYNGFYPDFSLARFNTDGSLDTNFGTGGKVLTDEASLQSGQALAIQSDGKIIVVGNARGTTVCTGLAVYRYNSDGTLDTTFDSDGKVITDIGDQSIGFDVVIQPDGKIVVAGASSGNRVFTVVRYDTDGSLDTSFSGDGMFFSAPTMQTHVAYTVALQNDGKIIAAGQGGWIRINTDGTADGPHNGLISPQIVVREVVSLPNGKIVFAGTSNGKIALSQFNADKSIDLDFGNSGVATADFGQSSVGNSVALQNDGGIVVGGSVNSTNKDFAIARFDPNGAIDTSFGNAGKITTSFDTGDDEINGLALQSDGKIVAAGKTFNSTDFDFAVARYLGGGAPVIPGPTRYDYDGDGRADISVFRPSGNTWYQLLGVNYNFSQTNFGLNGDIITPADFDGDGKADLAIFRPSNGDWWYQSSVNNAQVQAHFGQNGDIPRPADFDGDGKDDFVIYRPSENNWYRFGSTGASDTVQFGVAGDKPVVGDFDGDGKGDIAIYRPSNGTWWYRSSVDGQNKAIQYGIASDLPTPADFDGDGKTDFAVYRPGSGLWYIFNSSTLTSTIVQFGISEDKPIAADYDGDGRADIAVYRPSSGTWYLLRSTEGFTALQFGISTDVPIPNAFVP